jgi:hypothetical protein
MIHFGHRAWNGVPPLLCHLSRRRRGTGITRQQASFATLLRVSNLNDLTPLRRPEQRARYEEGRAASVFVVCAACQVDTPSLRAIGRAVKIRLGNGFSFANTLRPLERAGNSR